MKPSCICQINCQVTFVGPPLTTCMIYKTCKRTLLLGKCKQYAFKQTSLIGTY